MEGKEEDLEKYARKLTEDIQNMGNYKSLYNQIQVHFISNPNFQLTLLYLLLSYSFVETGCISSRKKGGFQKDIA